MTGFNSSGKKFTTTGSAVAAAAAKKAAAISKARKTPGARANEFPTAQERGWGNQARMLETANPEVPRGEWYKYASSGQLDADNAARSAADTAPAYATQNRSDGSSGRSYGGGGGGGGGVNAQAQMDYLTSLANSGAFSTNPKLYEKLTGFVNEASTKDQAAATAAYDALDQYLQSHQSNPYADVALQSSGGAADAGYGALQNVLALLGAGAKDADKSRGIESQMARGFVGQQIGATDNAYLFNIANREATEQQTLDKERRDIMLQLATLVGQGAAAPSLAALGLGAPAAPAAPAAADYDAADPLGWKKIDAGLRAQGLR